MQWHALPDPPPAAAISNLLPQPVLAVELSSVEAGAPPRAAYASAGAAFYPEGAVDAQVGTCFNGCREDCERSMPAAANPWWAVDLGAPSAVTSVKIYYSDTDCCAWERRPLLHPCGAGAGASPPEITRGERAWDGT
jgi:hypothetical protein